METMDDRGSRLRLAFGQLERAEVYIVAARELAGADTDAGLALERLRIQLLIVHENLRRERQEQPLRDRRLRAIGD